MQATYSKHTLRFITPGGTSRGVLNEKPSWFLLIWHEDNPQLVGWGECSIIPRLSVDDRADIEAKLAEVCENINFYKLNYREALQDFPSICFAIEMALLDLYSGGERVLFPSAFTRGIESIPINGLIWMGAFDQMWQQAEAKFKAGFRVLKMKVGALHFDEERYFIKQMRKSFSEAQLRLDANGAFPVDEALDRLQSLSEYDIHSIEQPIRAGDWSAMAHLCKQSPIAIALDEELIGVFSKKEKNEMLDRILPQYIILKPSLLGGFQSSEEWIRFAEQRNIAWWATSALESNIGLNAIAQWTFVHQNPLQQGLGTGSLYENNIPSPLLVEEGMLWHRI